MLLGHILVSVLGCKGFVDGLLGRTACVVQDNVKGRVGDGAVRGNQIKGHGFPVLLSMFVEKRFPSANFKLLSEGKVLHEVSLWRRLVRCPRQGGKRGQQPGDP